MSDTAAVPPPISRGTPEFRRMNLALMTGGFATFSLLYCVQPLLPIFAAEFERDAAQASLAVSVATMALAGSLLFTGVIADRVDRRRMMSIALAAAAVLTLVVAVAPSWPLLLLARALTGIALSGVPAVAMAYIGEEVDARSIGLAVGLHIGGNVFGGMVGRLATGVLADHFGWRAGVGGLGLMGLAAAVLLMLSLPASRRFRPRGHSFVGALAALARPFRDPALRWLFLESFLCMGSFVAVYNYIGFRLLGAPYGLSQTAVGLIFVCYLLGTVSSAVIGDLAGRLGRRKVFWATVAGMVVGVVLTAARPLPLVILGVAVLTFAFFGAHSVASSWVSRRAESARAEASSIYLFFYYLGASVIGSAGGVAWRDHGWNGVAAMLVALLALALAAGVRLAFLPPLPGNAPADQK